MADAVTDTTEQQSSTTQATTTDATASSGGADAQGGDAGTGADGQASDDATFLGSATATTGDGGDGEGGNAASDKDGGDADSQNASNVPEAYELAPLKITAEDGTESEIPIDADMLTDATPILKEAGISNETANKLAPLVPKLQERIASQIASQQADEFQAVRTGWAKEAQKDKEIGGKNWAATETMCAKALDTFAGPSELKEIDGQKVEQNPFRQLLNHSGVGDHPEFIRFIRRVGEKMGEDTIDASVDPTRAEKQDRVRILYPHDKPKAEVK